jgi:hypothetical protein
LVPDRVRSELLRRISLADVLTLRYFSLALALLLAVILVLQFVRRS